MIVRMSRFDIVVYYREVDDFLVRLQELGLVDVTVAGWEPTAAETELLAVVEKYRNAVARLGDVIPAGRVYDVAEEAMGAYIEATAALDALDARIVAAGKEAEELSVWGEFDHEALCELGDAGVRIRFYSGYTKDIPSIPGVIPVAERDGVTYFVVLGEGDVDARELAAPATTAAARLREAEGLRVERDRWEEVLGRAAASVGLIEKRCAELAAKLDLSRVATAAARPADGSLVVLEGWSTRSSEEDVREFLDGTGAVWFVSAPTPKDEVPVVLKNRRWSSPFELIGGFYSLPRYGTLDLTAFFGPFYMVFFGFCLGDAGYGLVFLLGSLVLRLRAGGGVMRQVASLTFLCGLAATVFGFLAGGFFGVALGELGVFARWRSLFLTPDMLFALSLGLGVVQILFALVLKIANTTVRFGFRYALGTLGWVLVVIGMLYVALPNLRQWITAVAVSYPVHMEVFYVLGCVGGVLMLFFHNPKRNPLLNFGGGLWNAYNDVTGLLGDLLSYIRLFALCLSGGTLALVFNKLALAMPLPAAIVVLVLGHFINLFMSALGSFVHPMRLTFVEFYKNAGFETTQREFKPLKK